MDDSWDGYTWEDCIERFLAQEKSLQQFKKDFPDKYETFVQGHDMSSFKRNRAMVTIIEQLRDDKEIPELRRSISHNFLRLWYPDKPQLVLVFEALEPDRTWIGLGKWIGLGEYYEQVEVPLAQAVITIKRYLQRLKGEQNNE